MFAFMNNTPGNDTQNPNGDVVVSNPPNDSIQAISWSPNSNILAVASWNCEVTCYQVNKQQNGTASTLKVGQYRHEKPALDVCWSEDGNNVISVGCDKVIRCWNPSNSHSIIGHHDEPIRTVAVSHNENNPSWVISGSWDKSLKFWDPKKAFHLNNNNRNMNSFNMTNQQNNNSNNSNNCNLINNHLDSIKKINPIGKIGLPERVYAMDFNFPILAVVLANKKVLIFDARNINPGKPLHEFGTPLKHQIRCISIFDDRKGVAVGSVEGRCAICSYEDFNDKKNNFAFKCHRIKGDVYGINVVKFHQQCGSFVTGGSDGIINSWDKDARQKIKAFKRMNMPITAIDFNFDGTLMAYSTSYDWSKGIEYFKPDQEKPKIFVRLLKPEEVQKKDPNKKK